MIVNTDSIEILLLKFLFIVRLFQSLKAEASLR